MEEQLGGESARAYEAEETHLLKLALESDRLERRFKTTLKIFFYLLGPSLVFQFIFLFKAPHSTATTWFIAMNLGLVVGGATMGFAYGQMIRAYCADLRYSRITSDRWQRLARGGSGRPVE